MRILEQRSIMSKADFEAELDEILTEDVPMNKSGEPNPRAMQLASSTSARINNLVDEYLTSNGVG